jgi:hypothetical protein
MSRFEAGNCSVRLIRKTIIIVVLRGNTVSFVFSVRLHNFDCYILFAGREIFWESI